MADIVLGPSESPFYTKSEPTEGPEPLFEPLLQGPGSGLNSDMLDGYQVSNPNDPSPNTIVPLNESGLLPASIIPELSVVGSVIKTAFTAFATGDSTTANIPFDNTTPQSSEGKEAYTVSITPTASGSKLRFFSHAYLASSGSDTMSIAVFRDSETDSIGAGVVYNGGNTNQMFPVFASGEVSAGSTSAQTFKVRFGGAAGNTFYMNRTSAINPVYNSTLNSYIVVYEIKQ